MRLYVVSLNYRLSNRSHVYRDAATTNFRETDTCVDSVLD